MAKVQTDFGIRVDFKKPTSLFGLMCIYKMVFENDFYYIGSTVDFGGRIYRHKKMLSEKRQPPKIQVAFNGTNKISFEILEFVNNRDNLLTREEFYLEYHVGRRLCLNESTKGNALTNKNMVNANPIVQFNAFGERIATYKSRTEAAIVLGLASYGVIGRNIMGKTKLVAGQYYFRQTRKDGSIIEPKIKSSRIQKQSIPVIKMDLRKNVLAKFISITEAAVEVREHRKEIRRSIRGERGPIKGKFIYKQAN